MNLTKKIFIEIKRGYVRGLSILFVISILYVVGYWLVVLVTEPFKFLWSLL